MERNEKKLTTDVHILADNFNSSPLFLKKKKKRKRKLVFNRYHELKNIHN